MLRRPTWFAHPSAVPAASHRMAARLARIDMTLGTAYPRGASPGHRRRASLNGGRLGELWGAGVRTILGGFPMRRHR